MLGKYLFVIKTEFKNQLAYIPAFFLRNIFFVVIMLVFYTLWRAVYSTPGFESSLTLNQMIWYLSFTETMMLGRSPIFSEVQDSVKGGEIAYTLNRPYSFNLFQISRATGTSLVKLMPLMGIGFAVSMILVGPLTGYLRALPLSLILLIGGVIINNILGLLVGLSSFWLEDGTLYYFVLNKVIFVLGGMFFPIEFLPKWLQGPSMILPFTFCSYWPAKLFIDFSLNSFFYVLTGQIIWIGILLVIGEFIFSRAVRKLHVQGG